MQHLKGKGPTKTFWLEPVPVSGFAVATHSSRIDDMHASCVAKRLDFLFNECAVAFTQIELSQWSC